MHTHATRTVAALLVAGILAPPAFAQPTPTTPTAANPQPGAGAPPQDEPLYKCDKKTGPIAVTFKPETELKDLITWVMGFTCRNFILDPRIVSTGKKVTVIAPVRMSQAEAYSVFLAALSTMGLTVVPKGNVMRIVESATAKSETVPIYTRGGVPPNQDQIVRYILRPSHSPIETLRQALDAIRSPAGVVGVAGNLLVITDYASQVRDMMSLARTIDVPGNADGIYTIQVQHADAGQLAQKLNEILGIGAAGGVGGKVGQPQRATPAGVPPPGGVAAVRDEVAGAVPTKILVDDRTNTLIVASSEAGYMRVKALVARLDISLETEGGSAIHVYPLANALAEELATTLNNALGQGAQQRPGQGGRPGQPGQPPGSPMPPPVVQGGPMDGASLEGQVRIIGDKATNSLIILSSGRDFLAIKKVIKDLDQSRRQIFIEALILEVQLSKDLSVGTSAHGGVPTDRGDLLLGGVQTPSLKSLDIKTLAAANGLIGGLLGAPLTNSQTFLGTSIPSYGILFQALATQDNTNILSAPSIIAIDNEKAEFSVGNNIPYKAGLSFGGIGLPAAGGSVPTGSIGQNIQREKLNLTLNVTPHISSNDAVRLEIEQETKDIGGKDAELGPTWSERKLKTQVVVHDQQSVVIGGLIQERDIYNTAKVPLLGDIPILGYLFKYSTKTKKKTNLLILLTPYIIKDQLDLQSIRERKVRERAEFVRSFASLNEMKYEPKVDYRRKRGVLEEINRSVLSVEQDLEILHGMKNRARVIDGAIDYDATTIDSPDGPPPAPPAPAPATPKDKK
ncbi:MAG: type II secretion system secretin GspD [Deltaproteobacteria bacterium]|nr:type II secretion system secretin GspD [Deltaproteobacteria bacterium]MCW5802425.1 type II secretion system secretin GspD [Deltaproteobacteria bacterium]